MSAAASHPRIELAASPPCEAFRPRFNAPRSMRPSAGVRAPAAVVAPASRAAIVAFIASAALIGFATNLSMHLLNLRMQSLGVSSAGIGVSVAIQALGIVLAAPMTKYAIGRYGVRQTLVAGSLLCTATLAAFSVVTDMFVWNALRFVFAGGLALLFTTSESLIIARADGGNRGRVVAWYATALATGTSAGPLLIALIGIQGAAPLLWGALIFAWASTPIFAYLRRGEGLTPVVRKSTFATLRIAPIAFLSAFVFGIADNGGIALLGVYSVMTGYDYTSAVAFAAFATVGGILLQIPLGYSANNRNPRLVLICCAVFSIFLLALLPSIMAQKPLAFGAVFGLGGLIEGLYTVGLICIAKYYRGLGISSANGCFISLCGFGELVGPLATGTSMQYLGAEGFVLALAAVLALYILLIGRISDVQRAPIPVPAVAGALAVRTRPAPG
jgi:predicted MFS family arabinose efflux permease